MTALQQDEYFTHPDDMRGASLPKQNTLMHKQLKSFETSLQQAADYYQPDEVYNLITPIIPHGVNIISFDGLQRIVGQSKLSKGGRKITSHPSFYFRAFIDDFLSYIDHLNQLKYNFDERIYSALFEYYYEIVFEDVKTTSQKKQPISKRNLLKVFDLPKYAQFRKSFSKEFVSEVADDCETLSDIMISLQMLVRKWGQLCDDGDIDTSLFSQESEIDLQLYPNCDNFEAIIRYVPDVLHKSKRAHQLAYDWWCLAEKIRKKLTGQWKPKKAGVKKRLDVPSSVEADSISSPTSSHSWTSGDATPTGTMTSRTSSYHEHCTPAKKDNQWVNPSSIPAAAKLRRKDTFTYVPKAKKRMSYIPRRAVKVKNNNNINNSNNNTKNNNNKQMKQRKKSNHQTTQTTKKYRDACTSPMVATSNTTKTEKAPVRELAVHGYRVEDENHKYSYSDSEFEDEEDDLMEADSQELYDREERRPRDMDHDRIEHLTFDIDEKVKQLDKETRKLEATSHQESKTRKLSIQVERAIRDIESLQERLQEIELDKEKLKSNLSTPSRGSGKTDSLKENLEVLDNKLRNMAGLAKINTYRQKLLASDMDLALELRGTFTRYNHEVKGKIELLERLIQEERKEQTRLEGEIQEMMVTTSNENSEHLSLQSVTSASTPERREKTPNINKAEPQQKNQPHYSDNDSFYDTDNDDDEGDDMNIQDERGAQDQTNVASHNVSPAPREGKGTKGKTDQTNVAASTNKSRAPHVFDQSSALSPLEEVSSNPNSATSQASMENTKPRVDSPSPKIYDSKRDAAVPRIQKESKVKLPKIPESSHMIQQS